MRDEAEPGARDGPLMMERARCAGLSVESQSIGAATWLTWDWSGSGAWSPSAWIWSPSFPYRRSR
jgi:hypothetical protein